jgi:hypothetical protein
MYFVWYPENSAVIEWWKYPRNPLNEKKYKIKQQVEAEFAVRLKLKPNQHLPFVRLFDKYSNTAIHPTRDAVEGAWNYAAIRHGIRYNKPEQKQLDIVRNNHELFDRLNLFIQFGWFLQFLRNDVFSIPPVDSYFRKHWIFERIVEKWMDGLPSKLQTVFDNLGKQHADKVRAERAEAKNTRPDNSAK